MKITKWCFLVFKSIKINQNYMFKNQKTHTVKIMFLFKLSYRLNVVSISIVACLVLLPEKDAQSNYFNP